MTNDTLGARLHRARIKRKMTRESVASILEESPPVVRAWELGFNDPRPEKVEKIEKWIATGAERRGRA